MMIFRGIFLFWNDGIEDFYWRIRMKQKIVVIGNGMAGARVVEEILGRSR